MTTERLLDWIAQQVRAERGAAGLTQTELALRASVSVSTVRRLEKHGVSDMDNILAICDALHLTLTAFFTRAEQRRDERSHVDSKAVAPGYAESTRPPPSGN